MYTQKKKQIMSPTPPDLLDSSKLINTGDLEQTPYRYLKPPLSAQEFKIL